MTFSLTPRVAILLIPSAMVFVALSACTKSIEETAPYQAACHGAQLRTVEKRKKADDEGYHVNRQFDCIDKISFEVVQEALAARRAANVPEPQLKEKRNRTRAV